MTPVTRSPVSSAGRLDLWLELDGATAGWGERLAGALVLQGTRGREHVAHAEVRLTSPPVSVRHGELFSFDLDATEWRDFLLAAEDRIRLPFCLTIPWGLELPSYLDVAGKVVVDRNTHGAVGVEVRVAPPPLFVRVAGALSRTTGLTMGRWTLTEDRDGAAVQLHRPVASTAQLKSAELQLRLVDEKLIAVLRVEWSGRGLSRLWTGRTAPRTSTFRFPIPHESEEQMDRFFHQELLPHLEQRPSGSLPIPAQTAGADEDQLPRIVFEAPEA
jgi:hypothetical protein